MTLIQIILSFCVLLIAVYMYVRLRSTLMDVFLILVFLAAGIFFILFPESTNDIAHWAGVSRGADLLFYLAILFLFFLILKLYSRQRRIEQSFTELIRKKSLDEAEEFPDKD